MGETVIGLLVIAGPCFAAALWRRIGATAALGTLIVLALLSVALIDRDWAGFLARGGYIVDTDPASDKLSALTYFALIAFVLGELQGHRNPAWAEGLWAMLLATIIGSIASASWPDILMPLLLVSSTALTIARLPVTARRAARQN